MNSPLRGRVAFVTGGATGIGRTIVEQLAAVGAAGLTMDLADTPIKIPTGWLSIQGDVRKEADLQRAFGELKQHFGRIDIVVANAGVVPAWRETEAIDLDEWDRVFATNVRGVVATIKYGVPLMQATGGSIVVLGSLNSRRAHPRQCLYTASKHAVLGIVRATALDLGRYGIRVNAIGPGPVATEALLQRIRERAEGNERQSEAMLTKYTDETALGRIATDLDVANAALFLASDKAAAITGQIIPIDGGLS